MKMTLELIAILALSPLVLGCVATTTPFRDEAGRVLPASVARMEYIELGGSRQWICVRGESVDKPLLLILHGGPGTPEVLPFRRYDAGLEKDFIVVNWDQRGSGKSHSHSTPADSMTIEQILSDAHELVGSLKESFGKEKIYLLGHSWGSMLGALLASRYPEDFHAYIGMGQWVSMGDNERLCYEFTLSEAVRFCLRALWPELAKVGLSRDAAKFGTPVFLFLGRHDWNTPSSLAEAWLSGISAPSKRIVWFENSAHCPSFEEPDKFMAALARISHE